MTATYVRHLHQGSARWGVLAGDVVREIRGAPWDDPTPTGNECRLDSVRLLAPTQPAFAIGVGHNFPRATQREDAAEREPDTHTPPMFVKATGSVRGHGDPIVRPRGGVNIVPEGEIVAVIGSTVREADRETARAGIFGVTAGNDVTARRWLASPGDWWRAKGSDSFTVAGPGVTTDLDLDALEIRIRINGKELSRGRSQDMLVDLPDLVAYVSHHVTLRPGDWVFTGTPLVGPNLRAGDIVEVEVVGVGVLRNPVVDADEGAGP